MGVGRWRRGGDGGRNRRIFHIRVVQTETNHRSVRCGLHRILRSHLRTSSPKPRASSNSRNLGLRPEKNSLGTLPPDARAQDQYQRNKAILLEQGQHQARCGNSVGINRGPLDSTEPDALRVTDAGEERSRDGFS